MQEEANPFGLEIKRGKKNIQTTVDSSVPQHVQVAGNTVDIVESFTYLGSLIDRSGSCEAELVRPIAIARDFITQRDRNIWPFSISVSTEIRICHASLFVWSRNLDNDKGNVSQDVCL